MRKLKNYLRHKRLPRTVMMLIAMALLLFAMACSTSSDTDTAKSEEINSEKPMETEKSQIQATDTVEEANQDQPENSEKEPQAYDMTVHFLDVGQGLSILAQSDSQTLIYDGGDSDKSSFVVAYLKEQGITDIDYLISSHYDSDHVNGLIGCLNAFDVENVICSDYVHDSDTYQSFINTAQSNGLELQHPAVGTAFTFGTGSFEILAPSEIDQNDSNGNSVAIKLTNGNNSFIFTGDAESSSESAMCASGINLDCDVLVPGHHGSATATSWEFLEKTVPEYAVISCGADNQYGHPDKDTMDKLQSMDIQVFRTDKQGTITVTSDGTNLTWSTDPCNDYTSGDINDTGTQPQEPAQDTQSQQTTQPEQTAPSTSQTVEEVPGSTEQVWVSATGSKYHNKPDCGNMNPDNARQMTRTEAEAMGLEACKKCY